MRFVESLERRSLLSVTLANGVLTITGTAGADNVYLTVGTGNRFDVLEGGVKTASYPIHSVTKVIFSGGDGSDSYYMNGALGAIPSRIDGGNGDDNLYGGSGNDTITGGPGRDVLTGNDGNDRMDGGEGDDNLGGGGGNDHLLGGAGPGRDLLVGGEGNDYMDGGLGADRFRGGAGIDTVTYASRTNPVWVDINGMPGEPADDGEKGEGDFVEHDMENVIGGQGNDVLVGTLAPPDAAKTTPGFTTNNKILGNGGNDTLYGLDGNDTLDGGLGDDVFAGGAGSDTADYTSRGERLSLNLDGLANDGAAGEKDTIRTDVENINGGSNHDRITGNSRNNILRGNAGNDILDGGLGRDVLTGGAGSDTAYYASRRENLVLNLDGIANDGAAGENDRIDPDIEHLTGGRGNDLITGNKRNNVLRGGAGNDVIRAGAGNDRLHGDAGADKLYGEAGNDLFYDRSSPAAKDILDGGAGTDRARVDSLDARTSIEALLT